MFILFEFSSIFVHEFELTFIFVELICCSDLVICLLDSVLYLSDDFSLVTKIKRRTVFFLKERKMRVLG